MLRSPPISADEQVRERWCWFTSFGRLYKLKSVLRSPRLASIVVVADDRYIEKALRKLVVLLQAAGAAIADGLVIRCVAGDLSIEAPMVRRGTMLIRMPEHCLIPLKAFKLALVNDEIVISSAQCGLNKATVAITEAMFEVYNLSRKMAQHCSKSPWSLIASHLDLLSYITPPSRDDFPFSARDLRSGDKAKVMLASFLHSRLFTHSRTSRRGRDPSWCRLPIFLITIGPERRIPTTIIERWSCADPLRCQGTAMNVSPATDCTMPMIPGSAMVLSTKMFPSCNPFSRQWICPEPEKSGSG
jgi:hypothetical protein